nr:BEL1-like homeodomain protein 11 [Ipomoea batatas]
MLLLSPTSDLLNMQQQPVGSLLNGGSGSMEANAFSSKPFDIQNVEQNLQYQGLSLSLAMEVPSSVQVPSYHDQYRNSGFSSLLTQGSQYNEDKNVEYLSFDLAGDHQNGVKVGAMDNLESSIGLREVNFSAHLHEATAASAASIYNCKYLKAAQDLLDEVVNKSTDISSAELSATERYDLESKMTKLFSLLDKVDMSYKQYYEHMQVLVSSFEMVAGLGAARPYTALALKTISCQFRCLGSAAEATKVASAIWRDETTLEATQRLARECCFNPSAWLFEHFLHPYPKDSEKVTLARQTGLTRSQVANWFINARVRLWKPMIEEMYKEEVGDAEAGSTASPPEQIRAAATEKSASEDTADKELQESLTDGSLSRALLQHSNTTFMFTSVLLSTVSAQEDRGSIAFSCSYRVCLYAWERVAKIRHRNLCFPPLHELVIMSSIHSLGERMSRAVDLVHSPQARHVMDLLGSQKLSLSLGMVNPGFVNPGMGCFSSDYSSSSSTSVSTFSGAESFAAIIAHSKYLRPAQSLLEEVVSVGGKATDSSNERYIRRLSPSGKKGSLGFRSMVNAELPSNEKHELHSRIMALIALLEGNLQVERRYEQYHDRMEELVSSFEVIAGVGAGKPYTGLALQAMSKHFCSLREAIVSQINSLLQKLSEELPTGLLDREAGLHKMFLQQLGMIQSSRQSWRPIRGLPRRLQWQLFALGYSNTSFTRMNFKLQTIFVKFMYPNDSEKLILASQTGLTKNQVSNWFINARVRLWKPMIEEMYRDEFAEESDPLLASSATRQSVADSAEE